MRSAWSAREAGPSGAERGRAVTMRSFARSDDPVGSANSALDTDLDLPDEEDKKSPVLLLGITRISESPAVTRRRFSDTGSIRFFRPPQSKYVRSTKADERLEKIRNDLLTHKQNKHNDPNVASSSTDDKSANDCKDSNCITLSCVEACRDCKRNKSDRGSFLFHRGDARHSSLCSSVPYGAGTSRGQADNEIEYSYTQHNFQEYAEPSCSKRTNQNSYNVTPKSVERRHFLLSNLNERFKKTLSLDSRKIESARLPLSLPQDRPKSCANEIDLSVKNFRCEPSKRKKFRPKSFFSLETFFDSKRSDASSVDDYSSSKYKKFELDYSPLFRDLNSLRGQRAKTPDLLNVPCIVGSILKSDTRHRLEKLENHYYKNVGRAVIDAIPKDATNYQSVSKYDDDVEYIEPIRSNFTSQSTLVIENRNIPLSTPDSALTIDTSEIDIQLPSPSQTVSPKSHIENRVDDIDSIGQFEIEVRESDYKKRNKELTVKVMDKSVDSIGSCSLDVDASTDFSDTTSGSLNLLTPSSTTSRIKDFNARFQERAASVQASGTLVQPSLTPSPSPKPEKLHEGATLEVKGDKHPVDIKPKKAEDKSPRQSEERKIENTLKLPPKITIDSSSHRSRHHRRREEYKKPSYLNLACSVNGYTNLTTYDSTLRQSISKSREASPIRPLTHLQYKEYNNSLVVPVPVSANKLIVPNFGINEEDLTVKAPVKALTDPNLPTSPFIYMAAENKQLKNDFFKDMSSQASHSIIKQAQAYFNRDEVDKGQFKSSFSESVISTHSFNGQTESTYVTKEAYTIHNTNGLSKKIEITKENGEKLTSPMKSFIQQRVERLYGPGALAQGFFNQKRYRNKSQSENDDPEKFERPLIDVNEKRYPSPRNNFRENEVQDSVNAESKGVSLPVLRHLRPEFRAQLPICSPKKTANKMPDETKFVRIIQVTREDSNERKDVNGTNLKSNLQPLESPKLITSSVKTVPDSNQTSLKSVIEIRKSIDRVNSINSEVQDISGKIESVNIGSNNLNGDSKSSKVDKSLNGDLNSIDAQKTNGVHDCEQTVNGDDSKVNGDGVERDGHYFLNLEKQETDRLLSLAAKAENYLETLLSEQSEVSEEVLGVLRAAAGKARLLATQKMQQFEGLCYNNINGRGDEPFPTTLQDLQGFWDMVRLQLAHVDALYLHLEELRANGWKEVPKCQEVTEAREGQCTPRAGRTPRVRVTPSSEKARIAAEKREAERRTMMEHRRKLARERQQALKSSPGPSTEDPRTMAIEGGQEVEIFVGRLAKPLLLAPQGDCPSRENINVTPAPAVAPSS